MSDTAALIDSADASSEAVEELGWIDYMDVVDENFSRLVEVTERISNETVTLGQLMQERAKEVTEAIAQAPQGQLSRREARTLTGKTAGDMTDYVIRMQAELPLFNDLLHQGAEAVGRAALMAVDFASENKPQVITAKQQLAVLIDALSTAYDGIISFRNTVQGMPRMTAVLNKAKRETATVIQQVLDSMASGRRVLTESIRALDSLPGEGDT